MFHGFAGTNEIQLAVHRPVFKRAGHPAPLSPPSRQGSFGTHIAKGLAIFNDLEGEFDREEKAHRTRRTHVAS